MPVDHLVISNMKTGYETDRKPFLINNDAFPILTNAYLWRGQLKRKRGTIFLGRLERTLTAVSLGTTTGGGTFSGNIFTILGLGTSQPNASIALETITVTVGTDIFTEPSPANGTLTGNTGGAGTINYATGAVTLTGAPGTTAITITFGYYPDLPVLGLEDFDIGVINQPIMISFDTLYSYGFNQGTDLFYDVTFYKSTGAPFTWNGPNYRQFYTTNYLGINTIADSPDKTGCLWATNGTPGFHFITISNVTLTGSGTAGAVATITTSTPHNLTDSDYVFINEVNGIGNSTPTAGFIGIVGINGQSGIVTVTSATMFTIGAPFANGAYISGGIVEYITRSASATIDGIRWYDGDPTASTDFGWVNFAPPLNQYDPVLNPHPFYLVGADIITPFKNRLIFSGVYLTSTASGATIQYFPNRIVYSQVGTPYYSRPLPFAINTQNPDPTAWYQNVAGKGGFLTAPIDQEIITVAPNKDQLIYGFESNQLKLIYTFDDSLPFVFYTINSEFGSQNTFSAIILDTGILSIGTYGIVMTTEDSCQRIDLQILDQVFEISVSNNNNYRVIAVRDYRNEWIYFTYCPGEDEPGTGSISKIFNSQTLLYNYRDNNWALFNENYTHYGTFRRSTRRTWASLGSIYGTWANWNDPWNFGANEAFFPQIVGGNQQGFVIIKGEGTQEADSQYISAFTVAAGVITITSPNHCLDNGDFIQIDGLIGITIVDLDGKPVNIFKVKIVDENNFILYPENGAIATGTYLGGGTYKRFSNPFIQTKQFPIYWEGSRGVRVGVQRYLLDTTATGQLTVNIYSSQNNADPDNDPGVNPYLIYQNTLLTSPEPNLYGPDPAYSSTQDQIWHRQSNSFNGDSIQFGFTLNDEQMYDGTINTQEIVLHAIVLDLYPGRTLA